MDVGRRSSRGALSRGAESDLRTMARRNPGVLYVNGMSKVRGELGARFVGSYTMEVGPPPVPKMIAYHTSILHGQFALDKVATARLRVMRTLADALDHVGGANVAQHSGLLRREEQRGGAAATAGMASNAAPALSDNGRVMTPVAAAPTARQTPTTAAVGGATATQPPRPPAADARAVVLLPGATGDAIVSLAGARRARSSGPSQEHQRLVRRGDVLLPAPSASLQPRRSVTP